MKNTLGFLLFFGIQFLAAQTIEGEWYTVDDRTGVEKAIISVYKENGKLHGKLKKVLVDDAECCVECDGAVYGTPYEGLMIFENLELNSNNEYKGKSLFDPEQCMTFKCKVWLSEDNPNELKVRGYLAFIFRTQTWKRKRIS